MRRRISTSVRPWPDLEKQKKRKRPISESASAHNNLGTVLIRQGRINDATLQFAEAVRLMPDYLEARYNLGNTYFSLGKITEAQKEFQAALETNPDFGPARQGLARISQLQGTPAPIPPVPLR